MAAEKWKEITSRLPPGIVGKDCPADQSARSGEKFSPLNGPDGMMREQDPLNSDTGLRDHEAEMRRNRQ